MASISRLAILLPCLMALLVVPAATSPHHQLVHIICNGEPILQAKVHVFHGDKELTLLTTKHGAFHTDFLRNHNIDDLEIMIRHDCNMDEERALCNLPYYEQRMKFDVFYKTSAHKQIIELGDEEYEDYRVPRCL